MTLEQRIAYYVGQGMDLMSARRKAEEDIRQRLSEIRDNNNNIRTAEGERQEALRNAGSAFGNIEAITDNSEGIIVDERTELQNELTRLLTTQSVLAAQLRQEKIEQDKLARQTRLDEVNKKATLNEAYKFFTYLDTATTKGYDVSGLSSDEVLDLYNNFRNDENYRAKYEETMARMQTEDREVIIPVPNDAMKDGQNLKQQVEENKPSAFAVHLYADGNNPMFENLEAAMAYAAAHPELEESWVKDNEVQDKSKDEFDPLQAGDEMPPASAQAGESESASQNLKERFKDFWKKHWSKIVMAAVVLVVIGATAVISGDVSAQSIQEVVNTASQDGGDISNFTQSVSDTINQAMQAVDAKSVSTEQVVQATQMYDPSVDPSQIFSDAYNASAGVNGASVDPSAGQVYTGDFFNPDTGQYAGVDTSNLTMDQVKQLSEQGYTVPLYTNDPSMMAADGNTIANAGAATGFGGPTR